MSYSEYSSIDQFRKSGSINVDDLNEKSTPSKSLIKPEETLEEEKTSELVCCCPISERFRLFFKFILPPIIDLFGDAFDLFSDIAVAVELYNYGSHLNTNWPFILTVVFIFSPSILFGLYVIFGVFFNSNMNCVKKLGRIACYSLSVFTFSLWPFWSYLKMLYYGTKSILYKDKRPQYIEKIEDMKNKDDLVTQQMLRAFIESAPQLLLQLYLLMVQPPEEHNAQTVKIQLVSVFFSIFSLTRIVVQFQNVGEREREMAVNGNNARTGKTSEYSGCCSLTEYLWWFLSITARVMALSLFASVFGLWLFAVCLGHVAVMTFCIIANQPRKGFKESVVAVWVGIIYIFCFVEYKGNFHKIGKVISLYILYYVFTLTQNAAMVLTSFFFTGAKYDYHFPLVIIHFVASSLSLIFMLCYLGLLRPYLRYKTKIIETSKV